jgi:hypothetical protein
MAEPEVDLQVVVPGAPSEDPALYAQIRQYQPDQSALHAMVAAKHPKAKAAEVNSAEGLKNKDYTRP